MDLGVLADPSGHPYIRMIAAPPLVEQARATGDTETLVAIADHLETLADSEPQLRSRCLYYMSLAAYLAADTDLRRKPSAFITFNNPLLRRARAAVDQVLLDQEVHPSTRAEVLVARGRIAALSLRWIESAAAFQRASGLSLGDPVHLMELGIGIARLTSVAGQLIPERILDQGRSALQEALASPGLPAPQAADARNYLAALEQNMADGMMTPCSASDQPPDPPLDAYVSFCLEEDLLVNYCGGCALCPLGHSDADLTSFLGDSRADANETVGYFNQVEEDYCAARYLAFAATHPSAAQLKADLVGHFIDPDGSLALDMGTVLQKVAYRTAADVLDKIAGLLNTHFNLGFERERCHFDRIFFDTRKEDKVLREKAQAACATSISLSAIAEMALDWHDPSRPENGMRRRRNRLVHHYVRVTEDPAVQHTDDTTDKVSFGQELLGMLRFVRRSGRAKSDSPIGDTAPRQQTEEEQHRCHDDRDVTTHRPSRPRSPWRRSRAKSRSSRSPSASTSTRT